MRYLLYRMRYPNAISCAISCAIHLLSHTISHCNIACDIPMMRYLLYRMRYRITISYAIYLLSHAISHCDIVCDIPMMRYRMRCLMRYLSAVPCDIPCVNFLTCAIICFPVARPARGLGNFCCCLQRRRAPRVAGYVEMLYFTTGLHQRRRITHH